MEQVISISIQDKINQAIATNIDRIADAADNAGERIDDLKSKINAFNADKLRATIKSVVESFDEIKRVFNANQKLKMEIDLGGATSEIKGLLKLINEFKKSAGESQNVKTKIEIRALISDDVVRKIKAVNDIVEILNARLEILRNSLIILNSIKLNPALQNLNVPKLSVTNNANVLTNSMNGNIMQAGNAASNASSGFNIFNSSILATILSLRTLKTIITEFISYTNEYIDIQNKLRNVTKDQADLVGTTNAIFDIAKRTGTPVAELANAYQKLNLSMTPLGKTQTEILRVTETLSKMMGTAGITPREQTSVWRELSDTFNKGILSGRELRIIMEKMPPVMKAISEEMGRPTRDLKKLAEEGKITVEILYNALNNVADSTDAKFSNLSLTMGRAFNMLQANVIQTLGEIEEKTGMITKLANEIVKIGEAARGAKVELLEVVLAVNNIASLVGKYSEYTKGANVFSTLLQLPKLILDGLGAALAGWLDFLHNVTNAIEGSVGIIKDIFNNIVGSKPVEKKLKFTYETPFYTEFKKNYDSSNSIAKEMADSVNDVSKYDSEILEKEKKINEIRNENYKQYRANLKLHAQEPMSQKEFNSSDNNLWASQAIQVTRLRNEIKQARLEKEAYQKGISVSDLLASKTTPKREESGRVANPRRQVEDFKQTIKDEQELAFIYDESYESEKRFLTFKKSIVQQIRNLQRGKTQDPEAISAAKNELMLLIEQKDAIIQKLDYLEKTKKAQTEYNKVVKEYREGIDKGGAKALAAQAELKSGYINEIQYAIKIQEIEQTRLNTLDVFRKSQVDFANKLRQASISTEDRNAEISAQKVLTDLHLKDMNIITVKNERDREGINALKEKITLLVGEAKQQNALLAIRERISKIKDINARGNEPKVNIGYETASSWQELLRGGNTQDKPDFFSKLTEGLKLIKSEIGDGSYLNQEMLDLNLKDINEIELKTRNIKKDIADSFNLMDKLKVAGISGSTPKTDFVNKPYDEMSKESLENALKISRPKGMYQTSGYAAQIKEYENYLAVLKNLRTNDAASAKILEKETAQAKMKIQLAYLDGMAGVFDNLAALQESGSRQAWQIGRASAIASATIKGFQAVQGVLADETGPAWLRYAMAASMGIQTAMNVHKIATTPPPNFNYAEGGFVTGSRRRIEVNERGPEFVMNAQATQQYRPLLESLNNGRGISPNIQIHNYGTPQAYDVQVTPEMVKIIANDEIAKKTPHVMANELSNPNSRSSKAMTSTYNTQRKY